MSFTTQTNRLNVGFLTTSAGTNLNGNLNLNSTMNVQHGLRHSRAICKEVVLNAVNSLVTRPYLEQDLDEIRESWAMSHATWVTPPPFAPNGDVLFDAIRLFFWDAPAVNQFGKIISDYLWNLRSNNCNDFLQSNIAPDAPTTLDRGMVIYSRNNVPARSFTITRPMRVSKGLGNNGISFELRFLLTNNLSTGQRYSFGFSQTNTITALDGSNSITLPQNSFGFSVNHADTSSYAVRAYVKINGSIFYSAPGPIISQGRLITMRINWDHEAAMPTFFVDNGIASTQTWVQGESFAVGQSIPNSITFEPQLSCFNSANTAFGIIFNRLNLKFYKYTA